MATIQAHDEVRVFDVNGKRRGQPEGGWPGVVVKVGRKLAHIDFGEGRERIEAFRLDTQRVNDNYGHRHFYTMEQVAERDRRSAAVKVLTQAGVELSHRKSFTTQQVEALAATVATFTESTDA